jgi:hypothetical protein
VAVRQDVAEFQQFMDDHVGARPHVEPARVDRDLGVQRGLVGIVHAGEAQALAPAAAPRALAYSPFTSRLSHTSIGVSQKTSTKFPRDASRALGAGARGMG